MQIDGVDIKWLGHAGFLIALKSVPFEEGKNSKTIYIDPYKIKEDSEKADLILITHSHYDNCSFEDLKKIVKEDTKIVLPADCQSKIMKFDFPFEMIIMEPNMELNFGSISINSLMAYNLHKPFHPKDASWMGYLLKINGLLIYHAGDTDFIPEMQRLTGFSGSDRKLIALLPVGGRFTMTAEEAAEAAELIKPHLAIPMHYGSVVGTEKDAEDFVQFCKEYDVNAKILKKE